MTAFDGIATENLNVGVVVHFEGQSRRSESQTETLPYLVLPLTGATIRGMRKNGRNTMTTIKISPNCFYQGPIKTISTHWPMTVLYLTPMGTWTVYPHVLSSCKECS